MTNFHRLAEVGQDCVSLVSVLDTSAQLTGLKLPAHSFGMGTDYCTGTVTIHQAENLIWCMGNSLKLTCCVTECLSTACI